MKHGFSLIELSIVLVILGLLTGGILAGKSLIRASELRAVTNEYTRYVTAAHSFRDKYFMLPGDINNATAFWGALDGNDGINSDCRGESSSALTCNGDGDGLVCPTSAACSSTTYELYLFWKHLTNAGMIEGSYSGSAARSSGTPICSGSASVPGCNVPPSAVSSGMWNVQGLGVVSADSNLFDGNYGNSLSLMSGPDFISYNKVILSAEEMWNIDSKIDDGKPGTGKFVAARWNVCATGAASVSDVASANYLLTNTTARCVPVFRNVF
jgi:prepilin-type N-terminal cleavage/methylation domain-containing protein